MMKLAKYCWIFLLFCVPLVSTQYTPPCTDFYAHVCSGSYPGRNKTAIIDNAYDGSGKLLSSALSSQSALASSSAKSVTLLVDLWAHCAREAEYHSIDDLKKGFSKISRDTYDSDDILYSWTSLYTELYSLTGQGTVFAFDMSPNQVDHTKNVLKITVKPVDTLYLKNYLKSEKIKSVLKINSDSDQEALLQFHQALLDSAKIKNISPCNQSYFDWTKLINRVIVKSVPANVDHESMLFTDSDLVYFEDEAQLNEVVWLIRGTPLVILQAYAGIGYFRFLREFRLCVPNVQSESFAAYRYLTSRVYLDALIAQNTSGKVQEMRTQLRNLVEKLKETYISMLGENSAILDEETRRMLIKELEMLQSHVAYDDWILDDRQLDSWYQINQFTAPEASASYLESLTAWIRHAVWLKFNRKSGWTSEKRWNFPIYEYDFQAEPLIHSIFIALAQPMFGPYYSSSIGTFTGSLGHVIGHELFHNLEYRTRVSAGSKLDRACFVAQYDAMVEPTTGQHVNGAQTLIENLADNGGIQVAWQTYLKLIQKERTQKTDEEFFYSFAKKSCRSLTKEQIEHRMQFDEHALDTFRVKGTLGNLDAFSQTFACPAGSPMNPVKKCKIW